MAVDRGEHPAPVRRPRPPPRCSPRAGEHHPQAGAHQRVVVDEQDADHGSTAARAQDEVAARGSGRAASSPPASATRSARPISPVAARPAAAPAACRARRGSTTSTASRGAGLGADRHLDRGARRVLAGVGQPLLHDPVGGAADAVGVAAVRRRSATRTFIPAARDSSTARGSSRASAAGGSAPAVGAVAQHADHLAQLLQRGVRGRADHACRLGDLLGRRVRAELQRAGVHASSSDSRCASTSCISRAIRRRSASRACSTPQRAARPRARSARSCSECDQLALRAHEQPPADHDTDDQHAEDEFEHVRRRRLGVDERVHEARRPARPRPCAASAAPRAAHRDVEQRDQRRRRRRRPRRSTATPVSIADGDRMPAPPPQRHRARSARPGCRAAMRQVAVLVLSSRRATIEPMTSAITTIVTSTSQSRAERPRPPRLLRSPPGSSGCPLRDALGWPSPTQRTPADGPHPLPKSIPASTGGRGAGAAERRCCGHDRSAQDSRSGSAGARWSATSRSAASPAP